MRLLLLSALCLTAAACGQPAADGAPPAVPAEVKLAAGMWEVRGSMDSIDGSGISPDAIEALKQELQIGTEVCLGAGEVANPPTRFFSALKHDCPYDRLSLSDGKVSAAMRCNVDDYVQVIEVDGTYGPVAYEVRQNHAIEQPATGGHMSFVLTGRARRTGEC